MHGYCTNTQIQARFYSYMCKMYIHVHVPTLCTIYVHVHTIFLRFRATLYQCPELADERAQMVGQVAARMSDLQSVLKTTQEHSITQLAEIAQDLDTWQTKVGKICRRGQ